MKAPTPFERLELSVRDGLIAFVSERDSIGEGSAEMLLMKMTKPELMALFEQLLDRG